MPESAEEVGDGSSLLEQLVGCGFHLRQRIVAVLDALDDLPFSSLGSAWEGVDQTLGDAVGAVRWHGHGVMLALGCPVPECGHVVDGR